jgi:DNA (cytosine-5)-methyltransferase 1
MDNRKISSQNNVHPGTYIGVDNDGEVLYSDPRALTLLELMRVMSLPDDWALPYDVNEAFVRSVIGEGIPPLFIKKLFNMIKGK